MKSEAAARDIIATMERETKSRAARIALAKLAISRHGNYDEAGKAVFRAYLDKASQ